MDLGSMSKEQLETIRKLVYEKETMSKEEKEELTKSLITHQSKANIELASYCSSLYKMLVDKKIFNEDDLKKFEEYKASYIDIYTKICIEDINKQMLSETVKDYLEVYGEFSKIFNEEDTDGD